MTQPEPARNTDAHGRGASRWLLLTPLLLLVIGVAAWSVWWIWLSRQVTTQIDSAAANLGQAGYQLAWKERRVDGWPYRVRVRFTEPRFASSSGRALSAPRLTAEATAYRPTRWVLTAPEGLVIEQPLTGPTRVTGRSIRASVSATERLPRIAVEGRDLRFTPAGSPVLFPLASAGAFDLSFQSRPEGPDEAGLLIRIENAAAAPGTLLQRIGGDPKARFSWESVIEKPSALTGSDWAGAVRRWTDAGGRIRVLQADAAVGDASATTSNGELRVGGDGRLRGFLDLGVRRGPRALLTLRGAPSIDPGAAATAAAVAEARQEQELARMRMTFEAGVVTLGPVAISPAPKVY